MISILIIGGEHDGQRIEVENIEDIIELKGHTYEKHSVEIRNHNNSSETFWLYTPLDTSLADIFRRLLNGYRSN